MDRARACRLPLARFAVVLACQWQALGWYQSGSLPRSSEFTEYVGKFCFDYNKVPDEEAGEFFFRVKGKVRLGPEDFENSFTDGPPCYGPCETKGQMYIVVFDDESQHWKEAQRDWDDLTCEEMLHYSSFAMPLAPLDGVFNRTVFVHEKIRPRFWYFTFAACGVTIEEPLTYELHTLNIFMGMQEEFGVDEEGSVQLHYIAAVLFFGVILSMRHLARRASGTEALRSRPILRMLLISAVFSALGAACRTVHYTVFLFNGEGWVSFDVLGQIWVCAAKAVLTLLQLLTAKGWSLFYGRQERVQRRVTVCVLGCIVVISAICEIRADYTVDWSTHLYLYESWTGIGIMVLNMLLFAEAWRSMCEAYRREQSEEVRVFYAMISAASLVYFTTLPTLCVLSAAFPPWVRLKYVNRAEVFSRFCSTVLLAMCLRPSRLDAMVNARLEEGLETIGEMPEDMEKSSGDEVEGRALD